MTPSAPAQVIAALPPGTTFTVADLAARTGHARAAVEAATKAAVSAGTVVAAGRSDTGRGRPVKYRRTDVAVLRSEPVARPDGTYRLRQQCGDGTPYVPVGFSEPSQIGGRS